MKIAFITIGLSHYGGERTIIQLANQMADEDNEIILLVPEDKFNPNFILSDKVKVQKVKNSGNLPLLSWFYGLFLFFRAIPKVDIIVATYWATAYPVWLAAKFRKIGVPVYFIQHYEPVFFDRRSLAEIKRNNRFFSTLILLGKQILKYLCLQTYKFPMKKIVISAWIAQKIKNDKQLKINVLHHYSSNKGQFYREVSPSLKSFNGKKTILHIPRKEWWKGIDNFIKATDILYRRCQKDVEIWLMSKDDMEFSKIKLKCRRFSPISDEEVRKIYSSADIFVSTSVYEGFSLPQLESMACGTPVVTTNSGGVMHYAMNRYNSLVVPPENPEKLAEAICCILNDNNLSKSLIKNGLKTAKEFTFERMASELIALFDDARTNTS